MSHSVQYFRSFLNSKMPITDLHLASASIHDSCKMILQFCQYSIVRAKPFSNRSLVFESVQVHLKMNCAPVLLAETLSPQFQELFILHLKSLWHCPVSIVFLKLLNILWAPIELYLTDLHSTIERLCVMRRREKCVQRSCLGSDSYGSPAWVQRKCSNEIENMGDLSETQRWLFIHEANLQINC